jgi:hypothetical protein
MSRCFPFPPPGYEKKIRTDEADPLVKVHMSTDSTLTIFSTMNHGHSAVFRT